MAINQTCYDTTALAGFKVSETITNLTKSKISNGLKQNTHIFPRDENEFSFYLVEGGNPSSDDVNYFSHPILFPNGERDNRGVNIKQLALDVRNYGKYYQPTEQFIIRNKIEYDFNLQRLILTEFWIENRPEILRDISTIPMATYANLISECVSRRFALNPLEQSTIGVICAYFYNCLFTNNKDFDELEYNKIVATIARCTRVSAELVFEILDELDKKVLVDLTQMCNYIKTKVTNVSLNDFNTGILFSVTTNTWFGTNAKEILASSLEHPPTWIMIVHASLFETTFKKSVLSKLSSKLDKNNNVDSFSKSLFSLIGDIKQAQN